MGWTARRNGTYHRGKPPVQGTVTEGVVHGAGPAHDDADA